MARQTVFVDTFTDGVLRPGAPMLGPVRDGGCIVAVTAPGCWGPMITPALRGGHEVTQPVAVEGAEVGDAIALLVRELVVVSGASASGTDAPVAGRFLGDPYVAARCASCGTLYPATRVVGTGPGAVLCAVCGAETSPFRLTHGYTMVFDHRRQVGLTLGPEEARAVASEARRWAAVPEGSIQNPILLFGPGQLAGLGTRLRPFLGQLGTTPAVTMPDSHNAGDFGTFLVGAPHEFALRAEELAHRTDGHLDVDAVRAGAILVCPVKVPGGGVYAGDMHALQGDGEVAGHTADVSGRVTLEVRVIKGLNLDGPVLFPVLEDLPYLARPLTPGERQELEVVARRMGAGRLEDSVPISIIGTGADLNAATANGLERAASLLQMEGAEVKNRATIAGAIEIGRLPGVVQVTLRAPRERIERVGLGELAEMMYGPGANR